MVLANEPNPEKAFGEVLDIAVKVIGNQDSAMRWLGTPIRALDYATPVSLLAQPDGKTAILGVLHRAEHGIF